MEKKLYKVNEELEEGKCDVIYIHNGMEKIYKNACVCKNEMFGKIVYFAIPGDAEIIGYLQ